VKNVFLKTHIVFKRFLQNAFLKSFEGFTKRDLQKEVWELSRLVFDTCISSIVTATLTTTPGWISDDKL